MESWNLDDVVRTSDEQAVRREFVRRNRGWLLALLIFYFMIALIQVVSNQRTNTAFDVLLGTLNLGVLAAVLFLFWSKRTRPWMDRRLPAITLAFLLGQFTFLMILTRNGEWMPWAMMMPLSVLAFRMVVPELVLTHAVFAAGGIVMSLLATSQHDGGGQLWVASFSMNAITLAAGLYLSRRVRRRVIAEWGERRAQAREQIRMRDELRYARELQLSMLPECAPSLGWLDISATSVPATEVGGDYYDYFVDGRRVAIVCGDVAGHGMSAGLVLAAVRAGFQLLRDSLHDPAAVLRRLHDLVAETSRRRMLVTMSVALLDEATRRVTIASAGHPPVLIRRASGEVETIDLWAAPLGVRLPLTIPQRTLDLAPGDALILHSDGIYETRNTAGESYGLDRLAAAAGRGDASVSANLLTAILADVQQFRGAAELDDDMTLVVARVRDGD